MFKYASSLILQNLFPLPHLRRVYAKRLGNFGYRLDASDRFERDLGFELTAEIFALLFAHNLLLFNGRLPS
jgi:hypothetical protein